MKTEIVNVPGRGICILISDIEPKNFIYGVDNITTFGICDSPFTNIQVIADKIRRGRKISAINEIRSQTGWGFKKAKEYMDKYMENFGYDSDLSITEQCTYHNECANNFLRAHKNAQLVERKIVEDGSQENIINPDDFLGDDEFMI